MRKYYSREDLGKDVRRKFLKDYKSEKKSGSVASRSYGNVSANNALMILLNRYYASIAVQYTMLPIRIRQSEDVL